jgi:hypothetical protein
MAVFLVVSAAEASVRQRAAGYMDVTGAMQAIFSASFQGTDE